MRVISGSARGLRLVTPEGMDVRPTTDRVKESLFNIIQMQVPQASVLDLFGGSGALGIEAASRGAGKTVIVDSSPASIAAIKRNVAAARLDGRVTTVQSDYRSFINSSREKFDVILLDPPYDRGLVREAINELISCKRISDCGIIVCESRSSEEFGDEFEGIRLKRRYVYGKIALTVYERFGGEE